jgi:phospholipase C
MAAGVVLPAASAQAESSADSPKSVRHGDIRDVKHVVILMQENRSFDHYFGTLKGVRGFSDRSTVTLPGGASVFQQPTTTPGRHHGLNLTDQRARAGDGAGPRSPLSGFAIYSVVPYSGTR